MRRLPLLLAAAAVGALVGVVPPAQAGPAVPTVPTPEPVDLYDLVRSDLGSLPDTGYTVPGEEVRAALRTGLDRVLARDWRAADDALRPHGYAGTVHSDASSGTAFGRVSPLTHPHAGRGSAYALGEGTSVAIHVPHPVCEPGVERMGVEVARGVRDSVLLVAGAKRFAGGPESGCSHPGKEPLPTDCQAASDPWVCETTVFHAWSEYLRGRSMPAVSLVGLGPHAAVADVEVDVPEGAGSSLGEAIAASVERAGFPVCRSWADTCPAAEEGSRSRQALAYKAAGTAEPKRIAGIPGIPGIPGVPGVPYVAVQVRQSVLDDAEEAAQVAKAVAAALVTAPLTSRQ